MAVYKCKKLNGTRGGLGYSAKLNDCNNDNKDNGSCWVDDEMEVAQAWRSCRGRSNGLHVTTRIDSPVGAAVFVASYKHNYISIDETLYSSNAHLIQVSLLYW